MKHSIPYLAAYIVVAWFFQPGADILTIILSGALLAIPAVVISSIQRKLLSLPR